MRRINFLNSILFLLIKYGIFFFVLGFIDDRYKTIVLNNSESTSELAKLTLGYILYILIFMTPFIAFLCVPFYLILRIKHPTYFLILLFVFLITECELYTYFFSPSDRLIGLYNLLISILCISLLFYQPIKQKLQLQK